MRGFLNNFRHSPDKTRKVVNLIRGKGVFEAERLLYTLNKKASFHIMKLLKSVVSNSGKNPADLFIQKIVVDRAPMYKRMLIQGRSHRGRITKRGGHIMLELGGNNG